MRYSTDEESLANNAVLMQQMNTNTATTATPYTNNNNTNITNTANTTTTTTTSSGRSTIPNVGGEDMMMNQFFEQITDIKMQMAFIAGNIKNLEDSYSQSLAGLGNKDASKYLLWFANKQLSSYKYIIEYRIWMDRNRI